MIIPFLLPELEELTKMCSSKHQQSRAEVKGPSSNADVINIEIIENLKQHHSMLINILIIIAVVVVILFLWKLYKSQIKRVRREVIRQSRDDLAKL